MSAAKDGARDAAVKELLASPVELKPTETEVKVVLPTKEDIESEKEHVAFLSDIKKGADLKDVEPAVKVVLPSATDIAEEKEARAHLQSIQEFPRAALATTRTRDSADDAAVAYAAEKVKEQAANFDHSQLKHAETKTTTIKDLIDPPSEN